MANGPKFEDLIRATLEEFAKQNGIPLIDPIPKSDFKQWLSDELDKMHGVQQQRIFFKGAEIKFDQPNFGSEPELTKALVEAEAEARSHG